MLRNDKTDRPRHHQFLPNPLELFESATHYAAPFVAHIIRAPITMPRTSNLDRMSLGELLKLRVSVDTALKTKEKLLQSQLALLARDSSAKEPSKARKMPAAKAGKSSAKPSVKKTKNKRRGKVAAKYRGPGGETWTGRGLPPRWLSEAIKEGKTKQDFLIEKSS